MNHLEQKMTRPGEWLIEGWAVTRKRNHGKAHWTGAFPGEPVIRRRTMAEVREAIWQWLGAQQPAPVHKHPSA